MNLKEWVLFSCIGIVPTLLPDAFASEAFTNANRWSAFDAGYIGGMFTKGYFGGVFDGRYVYYAPCRTMLFHGRALRYDTQNDFKDSGSWESHDAGSTDGLATVGYAGAVFDGRYVYYVPFSDSSSRHARVLRYDTQGGFSSTSSWSAFDAGTIIGLPYSGFVGAVFEGRYIYFAPFGYAPYAHGRVLRYDTQAGFKETAGWSVYDASLTDGLNTKGFYGATYDGRHVYFVPFNDGSNFHGNALRYDTQGDFFSNTSWSAYNAGATDGQITVGYKGAAFDGHYVYFVPFRNADGCHGRVLRYDTQEGFNATSSWSAYDAGSTDGLDTKGYVGAEFDGRSVYFVPYMGDGNEYHARALCYDTFADFNTSSSWAAYDAGATDGLTIKGYKFSAFDGKYIYFVPYNNGVSFTGIALRYESPVPEPSLCGIAAIALLFLSGREHEYGYVDGV